MNRLSFTQLKILAKVKKVQTQPQKPQNLSQIRKQMKDEKSQKPVTSSPKLRIVQQIVHFPHQ